SLTKTTLYVFFAEDYRPREEGELSATQQENGIIVSLAAHRDFLKAYPERLNDYLRSSLLHEFGHQLGLQHNSDPSCIMDSHVDLNGGPMQIASGRTPEDFCPAEVDQLNTIKLQVAK